MTMQPDELKALRKASGLTQTEFGEVLGMNRATISKMERGEMPIEKRTELAVRYVAQQAQIAPANVAPSSP